MWITWRALCWVKQAHSKKTSTACFCWYEVLRAIRSVEMESRMMVARGWGRSNRELKFNPYRTSMLQNEKGSKDDWEWWSHSFVNVLHTINCSLKMVQFSSVQWLSHRSLRSHESQHARPPCLSPTSRVHSDSCPSIQWCHPAISSSVVPFSSCPRSLPVSESFPMSQLFAWGGQSTGVSALASFKFYVTCILP